MRQSELFCRTKKEVPKDIVAISHRYLVQADFIEQTISGVYRFLPLGFRVLKNIERIIREEITKLGSQELYLPILQDKSLWFETERWKTIDPPLFKLKDRHQKETALGSTHEEEITDAVRKRVKSYLDLPFSLFQIQEKFRNEMRASGGLLRTKEFLMKDLYSFHRDEKDLVNFYEKVKKSYFKIFKRCGLKPFCVRASSGTIGGKVSQEFMVLSENGEDKILICKKCGFSANIEKIGKKTRCPLCKSSLMIKNSIEVGHIFQLGTEYSQKMKAKFRDKDGKEKLIFMGCYGIGLTRLMATIVEVFHDEKGIIWPNEVTPFTFHLIPIEGKQKIRKTSEKLYKDLSNLLLKREDRENKNIDILYDDRANRTPGEKFIDADLIGIPYRIIVSERTLKKDSIEIKERGKKKAELIKINSLFKFLKRIKVLR